MKEEMIITDRKAVRLRRWLYLTSAGLLAIGLASTILIYWSASREEGGESGYEISGGFMYPGGGTYNKKYVHDLQVYGGNAAILSDRFMRWFNGLWQGTSLAYSVGVITLVLAFIIFVIANNVPVRVESGCPPGEDA